MGLGVGRATKILGMSRIGAAADELRSIYGTGSGFQQVTS